MAVFDAYSNNTEQSHHQTVGNVFLVRRSSRKNDYKNTLEYIAILFKVINLGYLRIYWDICILQVAKIAISCKPVLPVNLCPLCLRFIKMYVNNTRRLLIRVSCLKNWRILKRGYGQVSCWWRYVIMARRLILTLNYFRSIPSNEKNPSTNFKFIGLSNKISPFYYIGMCLHALGFE